jgi:hypothetical protein
MLKFTPESQFSNVYSTHSNFLWAILSPKSVAEPEREGGKEGGRKRGRGREREKEKLYTYTNMFKHMHTICMHAPAHMLKMHIHALTRLSFFIVTKESGCFGNSTATFESSNLPEISFFVS